LETMTVKEDNGLHLNKSDNTRDFGFHQGEDDDARISGPHHGEDNDKTSILQRMMIQGYLASTASRRFLGTWPLCIMHAEAGGPQVPVQHWLIDLIAASAAVFC
jgi:hypothetical protein